MITKLLSKIGVAVAAFMLVAVPVLVPVATASAATDIQNSLCGGVDSLTVNGEGDCTTSTGAAADNVNSIINTVITLFSAIVGVAAVIMIIWGGLRYITSGGDSSKVSAAKNTIIYALIGLVVVALSQFIVKFVLSKVMQ